MTSFISSLSRACILYVALSLYHCSRCSRLLVIHTGRCGALLGTLAIMCFIPAFMLDDFVVLVSVGRHVTGLAGEGTHSSHVHVYVKCCAISMAQYRPSHTQRFGVMLSNRFNRQVVRWVHAYLFLLVCIHASFNACKKHHKLVCTSSPHKVHPLPLYPSVNRDGTYRTR